MAAADAVFGNGSGAVVEEKSRAHPGVRLKAGGTNSSLKNRRPWQGLPGLRALVLSTLRRLR
eukprot:7382929-Pyramimonas_sp.AAC.1